MKQATYNRKKRRRRLLPLLLPVVVVVAWREGGAIQSAAAVAGAAPLEHRGGRTCTLYYTATATTARAEREQLATMPSSSQFTMSRDEAFQKMFECSEC